MTLSERLYNLKRNDVEGALALYREGARSPDQVDWMMRLQDDPFAFAKKLAERADNVDDEPRDEHGQWTVGGGGTGKVKTATKNEGGVKFETGKPVTMHFTRNTEKSPKVTGNQYGQDIEPHGRYMLHDVSPEVAPPKGWEKGTITFKNPLVLPLSDDPNAIYGPTGWKAQLTKATGLKGKALSQHLAKRGHDAIVTVDKYGTSEIVDLTSFHKTK